MRFVTSFLRAFPLLIAATLLLRPQVAAAASAETLEVRMRELVAVAALEPSRFAVDVAHEVSSSRDGQWQQEGDAVTWHYSLRIPTAVSLSFHADRLDMPAGATLTVRANGREQRLAAHEQRGRGLWSRIVAGDTLHIEATMPAQQRDGFTLHIASFQAGYRGLDAAVPDHPAYRALGALDGENASAVGPLDAGAGCTQNFACSVSAANEGPGRAAVGVIVGNAHQCTGTLVNSVRGDDTPYVLTARHCSGDRKAGVDPASTVTVYWNAVAACGQALSSLYYAATATQTGAVTMAEEQDMWLMRLDQNPPVGDAYFAGFDARGGAVLGGYTIHHADTLAKQIARWYGFAAQAKRSAAQLGAGYASEYWLTVNELGTINSGASGGALFDQQNRVVGTLHLARNTKTLADRCPAEPLQPADSSTGLAYFTQLARTYSGGTDATTTTQSIRAVLDPQGTGALVIDGARARTFAHISVPAHAVVGVPLTLTWSAPGAVLCTATEGSGGDGWSGTLPPNNALSVTSTTEGTVTYGVACTFNDGHVSRERATVEWNLPTPYMKPIPRHKGSGSRVPRRSSGARM